MFANLLLGLALAGSPAVVEVEILSSFQAEWARLSGPRRLSLVAEGEELLLDGKRAAQPLVLPADARTWSIATRSGSRHFRGGLRVSAHDNLLSFVLSVPLEEYVARAAASETVPGIPMAALEAQTIVARSYVAAARGRHLHARVCDLAHCQLFVGGHWVESSHLARARRAAATTAGRVLMKHAQPVAGYFHAACGGHTSSAKDVWGGRPTRAAADVCPIQHWSARIAIADADRVIGTAMELSPGIQRGLVARLEVTRDNSGRLLWVYDPLSKRGLSGDRWVRELDRFMDWGVVRSARLQMIVRQGTLHIRGVGIGHGVGMCQRGARERAANGQQAAQILRHYFPDARVGTMGARLPSHSR